jgi:nucleotide-binding universal stress UspA family protein
MFKSIVWATDGSQAADRALAYVKDLAQAGEGVSVTIAHVVETGHSSGAVFMPQRGEERQIVHKLEDLARELREEGLSVSLEVRDEARARPSHEIAEIARAADADLIVLGTRGGSAVGFVLGGVTYRLLHIAPCPVLVVPPPPAAA